VAGLNSGAAASESATFFSPKGFRWQVVLRGDGMGRKRRIRVKSGEIPVPAGLQLQAEVESFFEAVDSYPARVATNPKLSFKQHLCEFLADDQSDAVDGGRRSIAHSTAQRIIGWRAG
jgi:hypothetical protein